MKFVLTTAVAALLGADVILANPINAAPSVPDASGHSARDIPKSKPPKIHLLNDDSHNSTATNNNQTVRYTNNWAGAVLMGTSFHAVTGTLTVPTLKIPPGGSSDTMYWATPWVGIGGSGCNTAILQTGIYLNVQGDNVWYRAWYEWWPENPEVFEDLVVHAGDQLKLTAVGTSPTSGIVVIKNLSTGKQVSHTFTGMTDLLCQTNAEWIVEDNRQDGEALPFGDFGTITFTEAYATTSEGAVGVSGAELRDIMDEDQQVLTSSSILDSSTVVISRTGPSE